MTIEIIENVFMLLAALVGLFISLFRYIERPKRGWLYVTIFFLCHILSDYYWVAYTLIIHDNPDVSALMAYFGWNAGYFVLLLATLEMRPEGAKRFFHPLMFVPIPINIIQLVIYLSFGGIFNNLWQTGLTTIIAVLCLQSILYWLKNKKAGAHAPVTHLVMLAFIATEYGMWTSSCYGWPGDPKNPYYYFAIVDYTLMIFFGWAVGKDYEAEGMEHLEKSRAEKRFQLILQLIATVIILGGGACGGFLAGWMKRMLTSKAGSENAYGIIAVVLFLTSVFLVLLILALLSVITFRYRSMEKDLKESTKNSRRRFGFIFTMLITLALMIFSVSYTSGRFYQVSVAEIYGSGEETAKTIATEMDSYLSDARSVLHVTADTVELMVKKGASQEELYEFLVFQTENQKKQFDENFTGIYAYVNGEYMDGSRWIPPDDYVPESRDWYQEAVNAKGEVVIVPPYVDAQTHEVVITLCKQILTEGSGEHADVVALDMIVNRVQEIIGEANISGKGYGCVVNRDGLIVAHHDPSLVGQNINDLYGQDLLDEVVETKDGTLDTSVNGEDCTLFVSQIIGQWYVIMTVTDEELFADVTTQLAVSVIVSLIIFALMTFFYYIGYKNEQAYGKQMEQMRIDQKQQEYEAQVLKLEKKSADEANKAKSSFLADMSHEIRTPINAILGMNEMILRESGEKETKEYAKNIGISGRNLLQLINSILDFSKIEDGKMEIVPVNYNVGALISYLENSLAERAKGKGLEFVVDVDQTIPSELFGDDARIGQVIMNLLTNAVKYTHEGSVTLRINDKERIADQILLFVEVKDTGIGIKEEDMGRLFESFERLDVVKNRSIEGTGLGMAITTKLLKLMGSELKVESVYGEGSVFSFELWQRVESEEPIGDYRRMVQNSAGEDPDEGLLYAPEAKILVTDDTKMNLIVVVKLLKRTEIQIDTAQSGEEALTLAGQKKYDVILMDQRMPGMDGTETLKRIRAMEDGKNTDTPVICLTADAIRGAKDHYLAEGFTDYLTKPVNGYALEKMLLTHLPQDKVQKAERKQEQPNPEKEKGGSPWRAILQRNGIDTATGMMHCQEDEEIYIEIMTEFFHDSVSRKEILREYFEKKDWKNYTIYVHSLKSSAKTIGAEELADLAGTLETAAKEKDTDVLEAEHEKAMKYYDTAVSAVQEALGLTESDRTTKDDPDILEFSPGGDAGQDL
ncbi:MAG: response regulator [Lachnospiraceae bacterium]|nr:response regulator [Lachnospiraceae bacterium]